MRRLLGTMILVLAVAMAGLFEQLVAEAPDTDATTADKSPLDIFVVPAAAAPRSAASLRTVSASAASTSRKETPSSLSIASYWLDLVGP